MEINLDRHFYGYSEVAPFTDRKEEKFSGFTNEHKKRRENVGKWAKDTANLAKYATYAYTACMPTKIITYFVKNSERSNEWISKIIYSSERLLDSFGDLFRNLIYGHKDKDGKRDDNLGLEEFQKEKHGDNTTRILGEANYQIQTKGKFLMAAAGLYSPELANDFEWLVGGLIDGLWWRNMGTNNAYGPSGSQKLWNGMLGLFNKDTKEEDKISPSKAWSMFTQNIKDASSSFSEFSKTDKSNKEEKDKHFLSFCFSGYRATAIFAPVINALTTIGSIARPIFRRLDYEGWLRGAARTLSVINKPYNFISNLFCFYLPEKTSLQKSENKDTIFSFLGKPDILGASMLLELIDFGFIAEESAIKESSGNINNIAEISRRVSKSLDDIYKCVRRRRAAEDLDLLNNSSSN